MADPIHRSNFINCPQVKSFALAERIEDAKVGNRIGAGRCRPLPAAVVGGKIAVDQVLHEVRSPSRQSISRFLVRNMAVTIRKRLCIQPVRFSCRIPASTIG